MAWPPIAPRGLWLWSVPHQQSSITPRTLQTSIFSAVRGLVGCPIVVTDSAIVGAFRSSAAVALPGLCRKGDAGIKTDNRAICFRISCSTTRETPKLHDFRSQAIPGN